MITYLLVSFEHHKPIPEVTNLIAGRIFTMDKVEKNKHCTARLLDEHELIALGIDPGEVPAILKSKAA